MQDYYLPKVFSRVTLLVVALLFQLPAPAYSQQANVTTGGFLLKSGKDTITIEKFTQRGNVVEGRLLLQTKIPIEYQSTTNQQKQLEKLKISVLKPGAPEDTPPLQGTTLLFKGNQLITINSKADTTKTDTLNTVAGAMAYHPQLPMISLLEQIVARARFLKTDQAEVPVFLLSSKGQTIKAKIKFKGEDSALVALGSIYLQLRLGKEGQILSGKTTSGQTITRLASVPDAALSTQAPDYSAPPGAPYSAEEVRIKTKAGHTLVGTLTLPKNAGKPVPVVVTITGSSPQDRDNNTPYGGPYKIFRQLADELGKKGIAVLRMDDRGVGMSTGNFENATTPERADDIREGIKFVQNHPAIDKSRIALVGLSEGAVIAPLIAKSNNQLNGIVLLAGPASNGKEIFKYQLKNGQAYAEQQIPGQEKLSMEEAMKELQKEAEKKPWLKYFLTYEPLETARQVKEVPVLIMQGTTDKNVPPSDAEKLAQAFKKAGNQDVTLKMFPEVNHVFLHDPNGNPKNYQNLKSFTVGPEIMDSMVNWIAEKTKGKAKK